MFRAEIHGLDEMLQGISNIPRQMNFAASKALNDIAFKVRDDLHAEMGRVFDRPTPWIRRFWVGKRATPKSLEAWIYPRDAGGKSVDPSKVLHAEVFGGNRRLKRAERALQRAGLLPQGLTMVPGKAAPLDAHGNVPGPFIVRLLSYFQAFGQQGYRANTKDKGRKRLAKRGLSEGGFKKINGVEYFVSFGNMRTLRGGAKQHLHAGIWSRTGTHGSDLKNIFMFVRQRPYQIRLPAQAVVEATVQREMPSLLGKHLRQALRTAR